MSTIAAITLKCENCQGEQPPGIAFVNTEAFKAKTLSGDLTRCGHCGGMTPIRKDLMTVSMVDGTVKNGSEV